MSTFAQSSPVVKMNELSLESVLMSIEKGGLGFTLVVDDKGMSKGLISNADVRKGLLNNLNDINMEKTLLNLQ